MTRKYLGLTLVLALAGGVVAIQPTAAQNNGPVRGYIQLNPFLTPGGTTNAQPACHIERRYACKVGNGSCDSIQARCGANQTRVTIGVNVYCDRWVC